MDIGSKNMSILFQLFHVYLESRLFPCFRQNIYKHTALKENKLGSKLGHPNQNLPEQL